MCHTIFQLRDSQHFSHILTVSKPSFASRLRIYCLLFCFLFSYTPHFVNSRYFNNLLTTQCKLTVYLLLKSLRGGRPLGLRAGAMCAALTRRLRGGMTGAACVYVDLACSQFDKIWP